MSNTTLPPALAGQGEPSVRPLVDRLRDIAHGMNAARNQATLREAAAEIESLRADLLGLTPKRDSATVLGLNDVNKQKLEEARQLAMSMTSHPVAFGTIEHTEKAGELLADLVKANELLAREAHTWWTAARDAMKLREPLAPEVIEAAAAEAFGFEGGLQEVNLGDLLHFARVLEQRHGIGA